MFKLAIVTPERIFFEADVQSLIVPGSEGYLGILSHHAPIITALRMGKIEFRDAESNVHVLAVSGGFLEVSRNTATLLAEEVEYARDLNADSIQSEYDREKGKLPEAEKQGGPELARVRKNIARLANRLHIAKEAGKR